MEKKNVHIVTLTHPEDGFGERILEIFLGRLCTLRCCGAATTLGSLCRQGPTGRHVLRAAGNRESLLVLLLV